jgi:hypothetical protein
MVSPEKWERVGAYGMRAGSYAVAKVYVDGCTLYELRHGDTLLKTCNDFAECQQVAAEHARGAHGQG